MNILKKKLIAVALAGAASAAQAVTIDFEDLPDGTVVDNAYFGIGAKFTGAEVLDSTGPSGNPVLFPPNSGNNYVFDYLDGTIRVDAVGFLWSLAGAYITGNTEVFLEAYDSGGNLLGSQSTGGPNFDPIGTPNIFLSVAAANIAYVIFHDSGNTFTLDDFTFEGSTAPSPVPDAGSSSLLLASALGALGLLRRKLILS